MAYGRIDPKKQFSKWLARFGAIIWGIYVFAVIALIAYRPEAAMACVWLTLIVTGNKALDTLGYTQNSTTEKIILGALERTKLELGLKGTVKNTAGTPDANSGEDEEEKDGRESNG